MIRSILANFIVVLVTVGIIYGGLELYVEAFQDDGLQYDLEMWKYAREVKKISENPRIGHEHRPNAEAHLMGVQVRINAHGHRDREIPIRKSEGHLRIMMIGDSLTFGWGVPQNRTFPKVVERHLMDQGIVAEVINAGVGNYNTVMEVEAFLTGGREFEPDIVILNYFINDAEPVPGYDNSWLERHSKAWVFFGSRLSIAGRQIGIGDNVAWRKYYNGLYDDAVNPGGWRAAADAIRRLDAFCREAGIALYLVHHPELRVLQPYPFTAQESLVAAVADELGLPYLNLLNAVQNEDPDTLWVTVPDPHPNERANRLFGDAIYEWLEGKNLLKR